MGRKASPEGVPQLVAAEAEPPPDSTDDSGARKAVNLRPMLNRQLADPDAIAEIHANRCQECKGAGCPTCGYKGRRPQCFHGSIPGPDVTGDPIDSCRTARGADAFGVFKDEECIYVDGCAVDVANGATKESADSDCITWSKLCTEHEEQPADACDECHAD